MKRFLVLFTLFFSLTLFADVTGRNNLFDFKIGSYYPEIDKEFDGQTPYKDIYKDSIFPLYQMQFDYQIYNKDLGTVAIGGGFGFGKISGKGRTPDGTEANDDTTFYLLPLNIGLYYQLDYPAFNFNIPFVPFVRAGLMYDFWWITNGVGDISEYESTKDSSTSVGYGGTAGYYVTAGMKILLDVFAPDMARSFDIDFGVNNTYLFGEVTWAYVNDFGSDKSMILDSRFFSFGISFDF